MEKLSDRTLLELTWLKKKSLMSRMRMNEADVETEESCENEEARYVRA